MRLLFYGLHLVSCEDIGMQPETLPGEAPDPEQLRARAARWLANWEHDPDLAADTRVGVPIHSVPGPTRFWCTLGVRPVKLEAQYARPPRWRPSAGAGGEHAGEPPDLAAQAAPGAECHGSGYQVHP